MTIEELAKRKTELSQTLRALAMCSTPDKVEEMVKLNLRQIEAQKELYEVEGKIRDYIEGRAA
jgi:hypothetical protein